MSRSGSYNDDKPPFLSLRNVLSAMVVFILFACAVGIYIYVNQKNDTEVKPAFEVVYSAEEAAALLGDGLPLDAVTEQPGYTSPLTKYSLMYMPEGDGENGGTADRRNWARLDISVMYSGDEDEELDDQLDMHLYFDDVSDAAKDYVSRMNRGNNEAAIEKKGQTMELNGVSVAYAESPNVHFEQSYVAIFSKDGYTCHMEAYSRTNPELLQETLTKILG